MIRQSQDQKLLCLVPPQQRLFLARARAHEVAHSANERILERGHFLPVEHLASVAPKFVIRAIGPDFDFSSYSWTATPSSVVPNGSARMSMGLEEVWQAPRDRATATRET